MITFRWVAAGLLVLVGVAWLISSMAQDPGASAATPAATPAEALQQELLRQNIDKPGDPELTAMYQGINARHFAGTLPALQVRWESRLADVGKLASQAFTLESMFGHTGPRAVILLNPGLSLQTDRRAIERALSHEIVHAYLLSMGDDSSGHGPAFQGVLKKLADEGAFEGVVATDEDRANLRTWLDAESARLDWEREQVDRLGVELERERAEVERAGADPAVAARREAYNQRARDANDRVARDRTDLDHFNQEVARYNLMLVYPDGLDERALVQPKAPRR